MWKVKTELAKLAQENLGVEWIKDNLAFKHNMGKEVDQKR
jgi:hypothetical protein